MSEHVVVIVGAGPTGMMLAGELALAGVEVVILERRATQEVIGTRALGQNARTIEVLDQRGIADRFLGAGKAMQVGGFAWMPLPIHDFPVRHPYGLALAQSRFEEILCAWVHELGVPLRYGVEVTGLAQDEAGVTIEVADGSAIRARYLVGCDGGRSLVRKRAGIAFPGSDPTMSFLLAEAVVDAHAPWGLHRDALGVIAFGKTEDGKAARMVVREERVGHTAPPTRDDLRAALVGKYGTDFGLQEPTWISRFTDATRQAATYRDRRVLLAGDAAHVHAPIGGFGLNLGVQDAVNLGWKLAQVVHGTAPEALLDSYTAERHPVGARVLRASLAQIPLMRSDDRTDALRSVLADLLRVDEARARLAADLSGLDVRYDLGGDHPLVGRAMPDLDLLTPDGATRVYTLLHAARPVLLDLGAPGLDLGGWRDRVRHVHATTAGPWRLPVGGDVPTPLAALIRPDGHVAWVTQDGAPTGLPEALERWFGPPSIASG